ncbi:Dynamin-related protein 3A [Linum perenne]
MVYRAYVMHLMLKRLGFLLIMLLQSGNLNGSSWGISSIFGGSDSSLSKEDSTTSKVHVEPVHETDYSDRNLLQVEPVHETDYFDRNSSFIRLRQPPSILRPTDVPSEQESIEITAIKLLLRSYYDIVRNNISDLVPKTVMHFLVQHTKRELHNVLIKKLYRENLFEEMLQEPDEIGLKRKQTRETLKVLQQAFRVSSLVSNHLTDEHIVETKLTKQSPTNDAIFVCQQTLEELPLEAESVERGRHSTITGLPRVRAPTSNSSNGFHSPSPSSSRSRTSSSYSD